MRSAVSFRTFERQKNFFFFLNGPAREFFPRSVLFRTQISFTPKTIDNRPEDSGSQRITVEEVSGGVANRFVPARPTTRETPTALGPRPLIAPFPTFGYREQRRQTLLKTRDTYEISPVHPPNRREKSEAAAARKLSRRVTGRSHLTQI